MEPSPNLLSPSSSSPEKENECYNDGDEQLFQLEPNKVRTTFPAVLACLPTHRSAVEQAPELTSDDLPKLTAYGRERVEVKIAESLYT